MGNQTILWASWETCMQVKNLRTGHGTMDWFWIGKGVHQGCILPACFFNLYEEYVMDVLGWMKHKLESRLPGEISITSNMQTHHPYGRKRSETKESLAEGERREWKSWLKTQHSKNEDYGIQSNHFMAKRWGNNETVIDFIFLGSKITADGDCSHEIKRHLLLWRKARTNLDSILKSRHSADKCP